MDEWIQKAVSWLASYKSSGAKSLFLPAGSTCIPIYEALNTSDSILNDFKLYQMDEVISDDSRPAVFAAFFEEHLGQLSQRVHAVSDRPAQVDIAWLGLGLNGHVGFHEPGIPFDFNLGCTKLDDKTCKTLGLSGTHWGVSYGLGAFMNCKANLMLVRGSQKAEVVQGLVAQDKTLPATHLAQHNDFSLYTLDI